MLTIHFAGNEISICWELTEKFSQKKLQRRSKIGRSYLTAYICLTKHCKKHLHTPKIFIFPPENWTFYIYLTFHWSDWIQDLLETQQRIFLLDMKFIPPPPPVQKAEKRQNNYRHISECSVSNERKIRNFRFRSYNRFYTEEMFGMFGFITLKVFGLFNLENLNFPHANFLP